MSDSIKARSYVPDIYKGFVEMEAIVRVGDSMVDMVEDEVKRLIDNQWIKHAREDGIEQWEQMLHIVSNPSEEDLEFRRTRILNRISNRIPFTKISLQRKLDSIIGSGNYILTIDYDKYIIYLESSAANQIWHSEIVLTMNNMKPCNMVFINTPFVGFGVSAEETINYTEKIFNYTLGSGFQLGMRPFVTYRDEVVVKLASTRSMQPKLFNDIATFVAGDVASVLINNSVSITSFEAKQATDNTATISYSVSAAQASEITDVKLLDASGNILTSATVYVPVSSAVLMKHTILVKEG